MSLVVNHNLMAMNAARNLGTIYDRLSKSTQRLSSGLRVNSAADDAAGLAIRELMRADIQVINQGIRNAADAISMIQTAEGAMNVIDEKLVRMKELAEQAATGTYTTAQREIMDSEYQAMAREIDRIANATEFNGVKLLDGTLHTFHEGSGMKIHFGTGNSSAEDYYFIDMGDMRATEATGLRVGNSDPREHWRTTYLDAPTATSYLGDSARGATATSDGVFGIQYSTALDSNNDPVWQMYGYVPVDANRDSVTSIVSKINDGAQARGYFNFSSMNTAELEAARLTINGQVFAFSSADTARSYHGGSISTVGYSGLNNNMTSVAHNMAGILNENYASTGVFGAVDGATLWIYATEFGEAGNEIQLVADSTLISRSGPTLQNGGEKVLTADAWWDEDNQQFELQMSMDRGGDHQQMRLFTITSASGLGNVIDSTATVGYLGTLATNYTGVGVVNNFPGTNEDDEWVEAQNGSGNTDWDGADIRTQSGAQLSLAALDEAITNKDIRRAELGAFANRLENTITNLQIQAENLQAAESRISDVDVAQEMTEFTRNNILAQAATAMLAQANSLPQLALTLLGG
jgi:flagellin